MLIVGTGAVATLLAQRMAKAGKPFQVFGGPSERLRALESRFPGCAVDRPSDIGLHEHWVVAVKTGQNAEKAALLRTAPRPASILVFQNGLNPESQWTSLAPQVDRALSTYGVKAVGPGRIEGGKEGLITLPAGSPYASLLESLGFDVLQVLNMQHAVWKKLAVNASLNVVATLYGLTNGRVLEISEARSQARLVAGEVAVVAGALGIEWEGPSAWEITRTVAEGTFDNVCSTLADFRSGRPSEYPSINGEILAAADRLGLAVPHLRALDRAFHALTASWNEAVA